MSETAEKKPSKAEAAKLRELRLEAMNLQAIKGNPLDAEDIAMFEMFEREGWTSVPPISMRSPTSEPRFLRLSGHVRPQKSFPPN